MEWVEMSRTLYINSRLLLPFSRSSPGCLNNRGRDTEEALAVGGALVLDFDVGA